MSHPQPSQPVHLTPSTSLIPSGPQTPGISRSSAIVDKTANICATHMLASPHTSSAVHHHGAQDTIVYAVRGKGAIVSEGGKTRVDLAPGDYALIPAWTEHQEVNDGEEEVAWCIVRSGRVPEVVNLRGWGGEVVKEETNR
ncbi:RmlC-like cupin domain-containing protein [Xylaria bambusicola]|uniref:RmlC-like cupin domain-containing protein n=1 Tax=Xylaria bambusicola TaxID=326684 RepID=UPI002008CD32|nr:RmlC-like cupin domain-containing protein [Xylaria bambusicola]KAI0513296.1 RmlC-like cupin domain-containing protein [Xylaria bambusicola]